MAGLNKVMLIGRLGRDPEIIHFENGGKKMTVTLATSERYRDREGNWQDQTEWHNVVAWGNLALDIAEKRRNYVKGDLLFIEGRIKTRQYTDGQGVNKTITEIVAEKMNLISKSGGPSQYLADPASKQGTASQQAGASSYPAEPEDYQEYPPLSGGDDLPF
ncbi:MAG TPA: single-stranded DNA-binding protein [Bacteroidales bacterium]|nr:single-stranded DNA-binding protein [Bacteroidales bacterium]